MTFPGEDRYNPSSPAGQVESIGSFAVGLTHLTGWRRRAARWVVLVALAAPMIVVVVAQLTHMLSS